MAKDNLIYELENVFEVVGSALVDIYTDIWGYEVDIYEETATSSQSVFGRHAANSSLQTGRRFLERKLLLIVHPEGFKWVDVAKVKLGAYDKLVAYLRQDQSLPDRGIVSFGRVDEKEVTFRVAGRKQIGSTREIVVQYDLAYVPQ